MPLEIVDFEREAPIIMEPLTDKEVEDMYERYLADNSAIHEYLEDFED